MNWLVVIPVVVGSSPISHPKSSKKSLLLKKQWGLDIDA